MFRLFIKILFLLLLIGGLSANAATISVMRDGSGDYTRIQPALDACASGDTLLIGPGEYFEFGQYQWEGYTQDVDVYAFIDVDDLTIIGSGAEETVIGPRVFYDGGGYSPQVMVMVQGGQLTLRGVTLRNGVAGLDADRIGIDVSDCRFLENRYGIAWYGTGVGEVENCFFQASLWSNPYGFYLRGQGGNSSVSGCEFVGCRIENDYQGDLYISDCNFSESRGGISVGGSPTIRCFVDDCQMTNTSWCISVNQGGGSCTVTNSTLFAEEETVMVAPFSNFEASQSSFSSSPDAYATFGLLNAGMVNVSDSHVFNSGGLAIWTSNNLSEPTIYNFSNNFWGTDDPAVIEAMILDSNDDSNNNCTVLYNPYSDVPVSTEPTTLDSLKAMYR